MEKMLKKIIDSMMDGLKDGQMFYEYAKEAKEHGATDLATYFIMRAKTRLQMLNEDHAKAVELIKKIEMEKGKTYEEGKWDCLHQHFMKEKEKLDYLVLSFK